MDAAKSAPKIGKIIKRARERMRMSQADAAKRLGVSRSALNKWENDRSYPRSSIGAIEELYGISLEPEPEPEPDPLAGLRDHLRELGIPAGRAAYIESLVRAAMHGELPRPPWPEEPGGDRAAAG